MLGFTTLHDSRHYAILILSIAEEDKSPHPKHRMRSAARARTLVLLSLLGAVDALRPCTRATRLSAARPSHRHRAVVRLAEEGESLTDAFANFVKQSKPKKPGEGAPSRTDVKGLPIGKGGELRDTSLGSIRAALQNWEVLKDPRNWQAEELGLVGALGFIVAAIAWGYFTYVSPAEIVAPGPSRAVLAREAKLAECKGDAACEEQANESTAAAIEKQRQLDGCLNYAFGGDEKRMCQMKYGGKSVLGFF